MTMKFCSECHASPWPFALVTAIAILSVGFQALRAASLNPAVILKHE